jgi:hypothetical protein
VIQYYIVIGLSPIECNPESTREDNTTQNGAYVGFAVSLACFSLVCWFFAVWGGGGGGGRGPMSVLEFDVGAPAYDAMKIHTAKNIRGALICEPNLFMLVCQTPPYQNPTGNIRKMKIL